MTTATVRKLKYVLKVSWLRNTSAGVFGIVGTSVVDGEDFVKGLISSVTPSDAFEYSDESENVMSISYDRVLIEPMGGLAMAILDVKLSNMDKRYTPEANATIGTAILPNRPTHAKIGFEVLSIGKMVDVFKGLSLMPEESKEQRTVDITCYDYVRFLNEYPLESTIYQNQRSDEIIESILTDVGLGSAQYTLDLGKNTIAFAWFEKGQTAGERIKKICEAEDAVFYQDENGILRFENRNHYGQSPYNSPIWDIEPSHIISWAEDKGSKIINRVLVKATPRTVKDEVIEVWRNGIEEQIDGSGSKTIWAQFENPVTELTTPAQDIDFKAYTATAGGGTDISSDITVTATLFTTTVKLVIDNANANPAYLNLLRLRGKGALPTSEITRVAYDQSSIDKYGEQQFELNNDFIDDEDFAEYMANSIITKYSDHKRRIKLVVQGVPQLQLRDMVRVKDQDLGTYKNYRVMRIVGKLDTGFTQDLYLREVTDDEYDNYATVGTSLVDGSDVVSP